MVYVMGRLMVSIGLPITDNPEARHGSQRFFSHRQTKAASELGAHLPLSHDSAGLPGGRVISQYAGQNGGHREDFDPPALGDPGCDERPALEVVAQRRLWRAEWPAV